MFFDHHLHKARTSKLALEKEKKKKKMYRVGVGIGNKALPPQSEQTRLESTFRQCTRPPPKPSTFLSLAPRVVVKPYRPSRKATARSRATLRFDTALPTDRYAVSTEKAEPLFALNKGIIWARP